MIGSFIQSKFFHQQTFSRGSIVPNTVKSSFILNALVQESCPTIIQNQELRVPDVFNAEGRV